jgi:hypothetical protein
MSGGFDLAEEKAILDLRYGSATPATLYACLFTTAPGHVSATTPGVECSGNAYDEVAITNNATNFPAASGDPAQKANGTVVTFPTPTGTAWGDLVAWGLRETHGGVLRGWTPIYPPKTTSPGDPPRFEIGALIIRMRNVP